MYQPKKYLPEEKDFHFNFIKEHPFATLVIKGKELLATHVPVMVEGDAEKFILEAHIANHNPMKAYLKDGVEALFIFKGVDGYISSSWYEEKDISTWDYEAVHINAKLKIQTRDELKVSLKKLVNHFEKQQENPLLYEQLPKKMIDEHLPLITGFIAKPFKIEAIEKLNQGYAKKDLKNVVEKLKAQGNFELAATIAKKL